MASEGQALAAPERLRALFHPKSVALVGATDNSRWSLNTYNNLKQFGFPGPVYLVHPTREVVHGDRAYPRLSDLPEPPDLVYVMVPTARVLPVLAEAANLGVHQAVVLTAGFGEVGDEGRKLEQALAAFARERDMTLLGPNGNGFINAAEQTAPYGLPILPPLRSGPVGIVLQSGALASTALSFTRDHAIGISLLVSMGNEALITATDVMDYLVEDPDTSVIAMFLESIRDAARFREVAVKAARRGKPIVVLKVGRSAIGQRAALAHTGALVGDDAVNTAALRQLAVTRVRSLEDLLVTAGFMGYYPPLPGPRMGVITASGGACDIIADRAEEEGLEIPEFSSETLERLREILPPFASPHNPLDVTGYVVVDASLTRRALEVAMHDPGFDFLLTFAAPPPANSPNPERYRAQMQDLTALREASPKPMVVATQVLNDVSHEGAQLAEEFGLHFVGGIEHGLSALGSAWAWNRRRQTLARQEPKRPAPYPGPFGREPRGTWPEAPTRQLLQQFGLPVVPGGVAQSVAQARELAEQWGWPVVLKVASGDILHKTDVGGVALNVDSHDALEGAYHRILDNVRRHAPEAKVDGILVSPMRRGGHELLVSVSRDDTWGQVLTVALGGVWVEVLQDRSLRILPVTRDDVRDMLGELRGAALLRGLRGQKGADFDRLTDVIVAVAECAGRLDGLLDTLELNPVWARGDTVEIIDALAVWRETGEEAR
jgi:acyl-CoA synthetase (NDP forming)